MTPDTNTISGDASPRSLWRNGDFLLLWSGQAVSAVGTNISALALPLLVLALTRSPAQAGLIAAVQMLPYVILSLPAGAIIDRWNRKVVMLWCDGARGLACLSLPLAFALGISRWRSCTRSPSSPGAAPCCSTSRRSPPSPVWFPQDR